MAISRGPSSRNAVRVTNGNACGTGSFCGFDSGSYFLTNYHVAGKSGNTVRITFQRGESVAPKVARVVMAAYGGNRSIADWSILHVDGWVWDIPPAKLAVKTPIGSHYTDGFPRCEDFDGSDITTVDFPSQYPGLWRWRPNAIGGQSGSSIYSDADNQSYGLLTWSWGGYGAGQMTHWIHKQSASASAYIGPQWVDGLLPLPWQGEMCEDVNEPGFYSEVGHADLPIWYDPDEQPPDDEPGPSPPPDEQWRDWIRRYTEGRSRELAIAIEELNKLKNFLTDKPGKDNGDAPSDDTFGL